MSESQFQNITVNFTQHVTGEKLAQSIARGVIKIKEYGGFITDASCLRILESFKRISHHALLCHIKARCSYNAEPRIGAQMSSRMVRYHVKEVFRLGEDLDVDLFTPFSMNEIAYKFIMHTMDRIEDLLDV